VAGAGLIPAVLTVKFSDGSTVNKNITAPYNMNGRILWSTALGGNVFMTSPLISDGIAVVGTQDDDTLKRASVRGIDIKSGKVRWVYKCGNSVKNNMAIWGDTIVAGDIAGYLYALDLHSGKLFWSKRLRSEGIHPLYTNGLSVSKGTIFAGFGNRFSALRVSDGKELWVSSAWNGGVNTVASPAVEESSGVVLASGYWFGRFAHSVADGRLLWQKKDDDTRICDNTPVVFEKQFFYTSPNYITVVNPLTGEEVIKQKINYTINSNSRPLVTSKYFIVGTTDKGVAAFDRENGYKEIWNFKPNPPIFYTAPYTKDFQLTVESGLSTDGENVYFGANDGFLYCIKMANGLFKWRIELGSPILGNIVIDNDRLYCCDFGGNLWCVKL
jgi:outer membrane protein assembly factor BamB